MKIAKIISGGQTGADRAALDAAIACGVPHGGWCPTGRVAEDGPIPACYRLQETETESYAERTEANVLAADATLIFSHGPLVEGSGTLLTQELAELHGKPCLHCDLQAESEPFARIQKWLCGLSPAVVLNVAGPRASGDPEIYAAVYAIMVRLLEKGWWAIQNSNL
jgi:hypothetical protein